MKIENPKILAIETSCDETAAAVLIGGKIKADIVYSQLKLHQKTAGVVPEVASRAHVEKIIPVIKQALRVAKVRPSQLDLIAVTVGPGLIGSLLVGVDTAKALGFIYNKPIIPINHIEAHIYANFISQEPVFPAICLVVSGGHTSLILMRGHGNYKLLGQTLDDAAGEAFDKAAKILGLSYPGGPAIAAAAGNRQQATGSSRPALPRPMIDSHDFNFSFSGLKTAVLYKFKNLKISKFKIAALAAEFQQAAVDVLVAKTMKAARIYQAKSVILGGGVAANSLLRSTLKKAVKKEFPAPHLLLPARTLCTDNAVMVGLCAYYKYLTDKKSLEDWQKVRIDLNPSL